MATSSRRRRAYVTAAACVLAGLALTACRRTDGAPLASTDGTLTTADGTARTYHVHVPAGLPAGPVPLLVALHGGLGWGTQFEENSGFDAIADRDGFVVVYPDGMPVPTSRRGRVWNGGHCCGGTDADGTNVDDVGFLVALVQHLSSQHAIDPARVFVTGHSNGAIMGLRLACERPDVFAAAAVQSGTVEIDGCAPSRPVSVLDLHGDADRNVPIDGGTGMRSITRTDFTSPRASIAALAAAQGCAAAPAVTVDAGNTDVSTRSWTGCRGGVTVAMTTVAGAGHGWMGHRANPLSELVVGAPYARLDASATLWSFLAAHPRP